MGISPCRPPWRRARCTAPSSAPTSARRPSTTGTPTAGHAGGGGGARAPAPRRIPGRPGQRAGPGEQLAILLGERVTGRAAVHAIRRCGLMVGVELDPPEPGLRFGPSGSRGASSRGVLLRPLGDVVVLMPPLHDHRGRSAPDGRRSRWAWRRSRAKRGERRHVGAPGTGGSHGSGAARPGRGATGRWRSPRWFDALGPAGLLESAPGRLLRLQRLSRIERAPRGGRRRSRGARSLGHPGAPRPRDRVAPHPRRTRGGARRLEGD